MPTLFVILFLSSTTTGHAQILDIDSKMTTPAIFFAQYDEELGLTPQDEMQYAKSFEDKYGWTRAKYQQYHEGIAVQGAVYTLHSKDGHLKKGSGAIVPDLSLDQSRMQDPSVRIKHLTDQYQEEVNITILDTVIMSYAYPKQQGDYTITYAIQVENTDLSVPLKEVIYISAITGKTIFKESKILHQSTPATAQTKYYGEQEIITELTAEGDYILRDTTRGSGIITVNGEVRNSSTGYIYDHFHNDSTGWEWDGDWQNEVSTDAHYCATRYHDWMEDLFGWEGVDGLGGELICVTNVSGKFFVNAFWNGTATHYGNGDCINYDPLTTLDVVGHEFAHGFTEFSSGLIYRNQSGALNESISDIIGKGLEYFFDFENFDWYIGNKFRLNEDAGVFRSMKDPHERFDPKFYDGLFWFKGTGDNGGVHSNSGLLNYFFYLLVEGESGINEVDYNYNVQSIGIENALDLIFSTQVGYLTENSTYFDAMYATLEVASEFWGEGSFEYNQILEAWMTGGLFPGIDDFDLSIELTNDELFLCPGEEPTVEYIIRNVGRETYNSSELSISWETDDAEYTDEILLPMSFQPGDSMVIQRTLEITLQPQDEADYEVMIANEEFHVLNNEAEGEIFFSTVSGKDLVVEDLTWRYDDECDATSLEGIRISLHNNGCELIPDNDTLFLEFQTSNGIVDLIQPIWFDFDPGRTSTFTYFINENEIDLNTVTSLRAWVTGEIDLDQNQITTPDPTAPNTIANGYLDDLENGNIPEFWITGSIWASTDSIINYQGNEVLAIAGRASSTSFINCPDIEDFYDGNFQKKEINFCVNTTGMDEPELRFEVLSKTRIVEENTAVPSDFHTMLYIEIPGITPYILTTTQDDVWEKQVIPLPQDFQDVMTVIAFVLAGSASFDLPDLEDSDYLLFDNFRLTESSVSSTDDLDTDVNITVSPNPGQSQISIDTTHDYDQLLITNIYGSTILTMTRGESAQMDISTLKSGVYTISLLQKGIFLESAKFIKL